MENNEIMNYEETEVMDEVVEASEGTSIGTGVAMLIGAGLTLAVGAGVKLAKRAYTAIKAKKDQVRKPDKEVELNPEDVAKIATK